MRIRKSNDTRLQVAKEPKLFACELLRVNEERGTNTREAYASACISNETKIRKMMLCVYANM